MLYICEPGSSVGVATDYGLDVLESNRCGDEIFSPSRQALGHTQPPGITLPLYIYIHTRKGRGLLWQSIL